MIGKCHVRKEKTSINEDEDQHFMRINLFLNDSSKFLCERIDLIIIEIERHLLEINEIISFDI